MRFLPIILLFSINFAAVAFWGSQETAFPAYTNPVLNDDQFHEAQQNQAMRERYIQNVLSNIEYLHKKLSKLDDAPQQEEREKLRKSRLADIHFECKSPTQPCKSTLKSYAQFTLDQEAKLQERKKREQELLKKIEENYDLLIKLQNDHAELLLRISAYQDQTGHQEPIETK